MNPNPFTFSPILLKKTVDIKAKPLQEQMINYNTNRLRPTINSHFKLVAELSRLELLPPLSRALSRSFRAWGFYFRGSNVEQRLYKILTSTMLIWIRWLGSRSANRRLSVKALSSCLLLLIVLMWFGALIFHNRTVSNSCSQYLSMLWLAKTCGNHFAIGP